MAEDNMVNQMVTLEFLRKEGITLVDVVSNGRDAVRHVKKAPYDLVLMDMQMPDMDGLAATQAIRQLPDQDLATIPIIALTANATEEDAKKCRNAGMDDYLAKPFKREDLIAKIRYWITG